MGNILTVGDSTITQSADRQVWSSTAPNTIVFPEAFADTTYTFQPDAPANVQINEVPGSRTTVGLQITVTVGTSEGSYIAIGPSNEIRAASIPSDVTMIQTGTRALVIGRNTITFPKAFADTTYTFQPIANAVNVTIDMASKTTTSIDVIMADDDPDFQFEAIGVSP